MDALFKYIEQSSYLQTKAQRIVDKIVDVHGPSDLEQDENVDDLIAAIFLALEGAIYADLQQNARDYSVALGYGAVTAAEEAEILGQAVQRSIEAATPRLEVAVESLRGYISRLATAGLDLQVIVNTIERGSASGQALVSGVRSAARSMATGLVKDVEQATVELALYRSDLASNGSNLGWNTVGDGNECNGPMENSCGPRHGMLMPLSDWELIGIPASPNLICSIFSKGASNCRCYLSEEGSVLPTPTTIDEYMKRGRARALAEAA